MEFVLGALGCFVILWLTIHLRPLRESEISRLAAKRRKKELRQYFLYEKKEVGVSLDFKKRMKPNGKFYGMNEKLSKFPSIAAALLKYKKHEWILIAFEKDGLVELAWMNKGFDRSYVEPYLSLREMSIAAKTNAFTSVLVFHNHPNSDPSYYDCSRPSALDLESACECGNTLGQEGINLVEFVCERGASYRYHSSIVDNFKPEEEFIAKIRAVNNVSKIRNLALHLERIF